MNFGDLEGDNPAEERTGGYGCEKISFCSSSGFTAGVVTNLGLIEHNFHEAIKSQRSMMVNLLQEKGGDGLGHLMRIV